MLEEGLAGGDEDFGKFFAGEAGGLNGEGIGTGIQIGDEEGALVVGAGLAQEIGVEAGGANESAGDGDGLGVEEAAGESAGAVGNLCEQMGMG